MTTKLRLKRTPAEEQRRAQRKAYKEARKAAKRKRSNDLETGTGSRKQKCIDSEGDVGGLSDSSYKPDYDAIRAELEENRFREKLWGALEEDQRLDGVNDRFNNYAHIPDRWARDVHDLANPQYMDDDEYAEWIREGMWKRQHAREYEEQAKRKAEKAVLRAREKEIRAETARLKRLALEKEERHRKEKQRQQEEEHRYQYEQRWKTLLDSQMQDHGPLTFLDFPWPIFSTQFTKQNVMDSHPPLRVEYITSDAVAAFLLPVGNSDTLAKGNDISKRNRDKLKDALLRFHPDKFDGRFMHRVLESDVESVREAVGQVARALNVLMNGKP